MNAESESVVTDVLVVGAGAAGLTAANAAAAAGREVIVLEAGPRPGGTTAKSFGGFLVTANRFHRESGIVEDRDATLRLMAQLSFPERYDPTAERLGLDQLDYDLMTTFYDRSSEVIEALEAEGTIVCAPQLAVSGDPRGFPSYFIELEDETITYGRTLTTRTPDGMEGYGAELARQLQAGAERKGARIICEQRVSEILRDGDEVVGLKTTGAGGERTYLARHGVVFGSGGFLQNRELVERHMPGLMLGGGAVAESVGDILELTAELDVDLAHLDQAWWGQVPAEIALAMPSTPMLLLFAFGDSMLFVNRDGRRVVNEKAIYNTRPKVHFERDESGELPNRLLFMVYDHALAMEPSAQFPTRWPIPPAGQDAPHIIKGETLEDLEAALAERLETIAEHTGALTLADGFAARLRESIATFGAYAERGRDEEFGRGELPIEIDGSGPGRVGNHPNRTMYPLSPQGPYYCVIVAASAMDTKGGPRINTKSELLRTDGTPIPRLYGAGNCVASPSAAAYWSGGVTLGLAMTYGYIAGQEVSSLEPRPPVGELTAAQA
jgi:succinate dehydrogenase/fumarate reductase flavoprotein subunit